MYTIARHNQPPESTIHLTRSTGNMAQPIVEALNPKAKIYCCKEAVSRREVRDVLHHNVFEYREEDGLEPGVLYFIDLQPDSAWPHSCIYILIE